MVTSGPTVKAGVEDRRPVTPEIDDRLPEQEQPGTVTVAYQDNELVVGSDGKRYRLRKGPPGRMGTSGPEVGGASIGWSCPYKQMGKHPALIHKLALKLKALLACRT